LIRHKKQLSKFESVDDYFVAQVTNTTELKGVTKDIDWIFSTIGITRQKDGLSYMDVDYKGNHNLLTEAKKTGVSAFQYVSAINGDKMRHLKIFEAKEKFVDELRGSGLDYCIIRPSGFYSDLRDFLNMAKNGRVYLFGDGQLKLNPIHGEDLAKVCVDKMEAGIKEVTVGGSEILSHKQIAELALQAWNKPVKITHLPDWIRRLTIIVFRLFTSSKTYGSIEFFLTAMATDNLADAYGYHQLDDFFKKEVNEELQSKGV
jgi:uncharacterized protein YbjT (DUF2867 family)